MEFQTYTLGDLVRTKMERQHLSLRRAAHQIGMAHTTVDRIVKDESLDLSTIQKACDWLDIPIHTVLDVDYRDIEVLNNVVGFLAMNQELAVRIFELSTNIKSGNVSPLILGEIAAFISYRSHVLSGQ
jgi:transcriptional regulator with XRE-family HTH domain